MKNNMSKQINKNIYNFLIIFIIIIFIYIIYNFYNKKTYYSEIMCIGSGVSSAYACYQIKKHNINNNKIIVLEKDNNYGGRIKSVFSNVNKQNHLEVAYAELGAMRIFDIKPMKKIFDLLKVFGLKTIKVSLEDSDNIFYYNGTKYAKSEARLSNGIKVSEFEEYTINNLKNKYPDINFEEIFDYEELRNLNIKEFFEKYGNANNDDINMWIAYSGYNIYDYVDNIQVARHLYAKNFFNTKDKDKQYYILDGMIALVKKLFENSNAEIIYNTKAISIQKDSQGYNIINTINSNNVYEQYKCKYLFIGLTLKQMKELNTYQQIPISPLRIQMINEVISIPLFKVFLKWDKKNIWWGEGKKYRIGKSTTNLPIRQIHYYDDEDILIYNSGRYATELNKKFEENPAKAAVEVYEQIKIMHQMDIPPPNYIYTIYKYWPDGSQVWLKGADVNKNVEIIPNGSIDKSNIFIIGDSFSKYQGWVIGALNSVDVALKSFPNYNYK